MAGRRSGSHSGSGGMTPLELKIMQVLWRLGPSQVQAVQAGARRRPGVHDGADDAERAAQEGAGDAASARARVMSIAPR